MQMVGHKTESIYRRYAIVDKAMLREAAARLDAYIGAPTPQSKTGTVKTFKPKTAKVTACVNIGCATQGPNGSSDWSRTRLTMS